MALTDEIRKGAGEVARAAPGVLYKAAELAKQKAGELLGRPGQRREGTREQARGQARHDQAARQQRVTAQSLVKSHTRPALERRARELGIKGRSKMNKKQLAEAIVARS